MTSLMTLLMVIAGVTDRPRPQHRAAVFARSRRDGRAEGSEA